MIARLPIADERTEKWLVARLRELKRTVATAESCTGGLLANRLTNIPGASEVFGLGYITYANEAKITQLGVDRELIARHGAASTEVAVAMAEGAREKAAADYALSLTGIAGPGGGSSDKPVGTVFVALARRAGGTLCRREIFSADRETFKRLATQAALEMLRQELS